MTVTNPTIKHTFAERAAASNLSDAEIINSNNLDGSDIPTDADVVVAGGGIQGLIYSVHAASYKPGKLKIVVIEKASRPGYKVGESTLPLFSLWCKMFGLTGEYMLRMFALKDGMSFYFLDGENHKNYKHLASNGVPGLFLSGFQLERPMSELLFTMVAQRRGINVYHGKQVDFTSSQVQGGHGRNKINIALGKFDNKPATTIDSSLLIDATGRFRQLTSKKSPTNRFEGWNSDAFWGYFTWPKDESRIPFRFYEGANTNHITFPEGWMWIIRLQSWVGNPVANLMDMITYLLDCAEAGTPGDQIPSSQELARMFSLKTRWIMSIGFTVRNDVKYPEDMSEYGSREAERKFNYFVQKYSLIQELMASFELLTDVYGPGTTWFIRKSLSFYSPVVSGPGWMAIGDACGFTNPLWSPGITVSMATSTWAAELTHEAFNQAAENPESADTIMRKVLKPYDEYMQNLMPALDRMNRFHYECFRDPRLPPQVSCLWQFLVGIATPDWQLIRQNYDLNFDTYVPHNLNWAWGVFVDEYKVVERRALELLTPIPLGERIPESVVSELIKLATITKDKAVDSGRFNFRWDGLLRHYDIFLNYSETKTYKDIFVRQCKNTECATWLALTPAWKKCYTCGTERSTEDASIVWNPPLPVEEVEALVHAADNKSRHQVVQ